MVVSDLHFGQIILQGGECAGKWPDWRLEDELGGYCCNPDRIQNEVVTVTKDRKAYMYEIYIYNVGYKILELFVSGNGKKGGVKDSALGNYLYVGIIH